MKSKLAQIKFYFPRISPEIKDAREFIGLLLKTMKRKGDLRYAGYLKEKDLKNELLRQMKGWDIAQYKTPSAKEEKVIEKTVQAAVKKCHKVLPHPNLPIFVFVYPWFPEKDTHIQFGGTTAIATYYTMHLFIDLRAYAQATLKQTIAHEWNHLVFYRYHPARQYTLLVNMLIEGLAEVFREEVMGGKPAPWALALDAKDARKQLTLLRSKLDRKSMKIYRDVFFGSKKYKRWTGYSVGYRLVKEFRKNYPGFSWEEIMKIKPENIFESATKKGA